MMKKTAIFLPALAVATVAASPLLASSEPFVSLRNTHFVVLVAFLIFCGALIYLKVPGLLAKQLDKRADDIRSELDEARALREEAQTILATYERKQREVKDQAARIVAHAREEAALSAEAAKADLAASIARRLAAAEEQIASAQDAAVREVRDQSVKAAVAAASDVIAKSMSAAEAGKLIDSAIADVETKLH